MPLCIGVESTRGGDVSCIGTGSSLGGNSDIGILVSARDVVQDIEPASIRMSHIVIRTNV